MLSSSFLNDSCSSSLSLHSVLALAIKFSPDSKQRVPLSSFLIHLSPLSSSNSNSLNPPSPRFVKQKTDDSDSKETNCLRSVSEQGSDFVLEKFFKFKNELDDFKSLTINPRGHVNRKIGIFVLENAHLFHIIQSFLAPMSDKDRNLPYPKTVEMNRKRELSNVDNGKILNRYFLKSNASSYSEFKEWIKQSAIRIPDFSDILSLVSTNKKIREIFCKLNPKGVIEQRVTLSKIFILFQSSLTRIDKSEADNRFSKFLKYSLNECNLDVLKPLLSLPSYLEPKGIFPVLEQVLVGISSEFSENKQVFFEKASDLIADKMTALDFSLVNSELEYSLYSLADCPRSIGFSWLMRWMENLSSKQRLIFKEKLAQAQFINRTGTSLLFTAIKRRHSSIVKEISLHFPDHCQKMVEKLPEGSLKEMRELMANPDC